MSDTSPEFDAYERLLDSARDQDLIAERMATTINRFRLYLTDRGVIFDVEEFFAGIGIPDRKFFDEDELQTLATSNLLRIHTLSTAKVMGNIAEEAGHIDSEMKGQLQAMLIADGCSDPWLELVDYEFGGDSVNDNDAAIQRNALVKALTDATNEVEYLAVVEKLTAYLRKQGTTDLGQLDMMAIGEIGVSLSILQVRDSDMLRANLAESARLTVIKQGLDINLWNGLITHFFEQSD